jgi:hypothetical protein
MTSRGAGNRSAYNPQRTGIAMTHGRKRLVAAVCVLIGSVHLQAATGSVDAQAGDAAVKQLVGMWRLVSWTQRTTDGTSLPGPTDAGYLVYSDVDRMCAVMMDSKRPRWAPGAPATVEQAVARFSGFISYCAAVEVDAKAGFLLHHVDVERSPNIVGTTRKRWFRFESPNRLVLRIDAAELGAGLTESALVWERVQN